MSFNVPNVSDSEFPNTLVSGPSQQISGSWNLIENGMHSNWNHVRHQLPPTSLQSGNYQVPNLWNPLDQGWQNVHQELPVQRNGIIYPQRSQNTSMPPSIRPQAPKKPKRVRTAFTTDQLLALEETFQKTTYVSKAERVSLSQQLSLKDRAIKVWFQNRRMKQKREKDTCKTSEDESPPPSECSSSTDVSLVQSNDYQHTIVDNQSLTEPAPVQAPQYQHFNAGRSEDYLRNVVPIFNSTPASMQQQEFINIENIPYPFLIQKGFNGYRNSISFDQPHQPQQSSNNNQFHVSEHVTANNFSSNNSVPLNKLGALVSQCINNEFDDSSVYEACSNAQYNDIHNPALADSQQYYHNNTAEQSRIYEGQDCQPKPYNGSSLTAQNVPSHNATEIKYEDISLDSVDIEEHNIADQEKDRKAAIIARKILLE